MREWSSLFTDIVGSTEKAVALGDSAWAEPAPALGGGVNIVGAVRPLGLTVRVGVHTGDRFLADGKCGGLAIHMAHESSTWTRQARCSSPRQFAAAPALPIASTTEAACTS